jgi:hypothetical protein
MNGNFAFLSALLWHLDRLATLAGPLWPGVRAELQRLLADVIAEKSASLLPLRVNRIFRAFCGTPAESFVQALLAQSMPPIHVDLVTRGLDTSLPVNVPQAAIESQSVANVARELAERMSLDVTPAENAKPQAPATERQINAWLTGRGPTEPIAPGLRYELNIGVGEAMAGSLIDPASARVARGDVKQGGLRTTWIVESSGFELSSVDSDVNVTQEKDRWIARFALTIPEKGDSDVRRLLVVARVANASALQVLVYAVDGDRRELYRQLAIHVPVGGAEVLAPVGVRDEVVCAPAKQMNLRPAHEWTTPPGRLSVTVVPGARAAVVGTVAGSTVDGEVVDWYAQQATLAGAITNVRDAAEKFRGKWESYLDDIDPNELVQRLGAFKPMYSWNSGQSNVGAAHAARWDQARRSAELRNLAVYGRELYDAAFPPGSALRTWIDSLAAGWRLDIQWTEQSGPGYVPNVPWGLMYASDPPAEGQPVEPLGFLALRLRIGYRAYQGVSGGAKALGNVAATRQAYGLYWGNQPNDVAGVEATRQRALFSAWQSAFVVPANAGGAGGRAELLDLLAKSDAATVIMYFFCHAAVGNGNQPVLRFGPTSAQTDVLQTTDLLGGKPLPGQPFIFANACTTSAADPYIANSLEMSLFRRGCRGFLGTETKVPIRLASRLATVFFSFFYRHVDKAPMAAGEALAQTRQFLFNEYANIGGIFYTYLNQYELFLAGTEEVAALGSAGGGAP